MHSRAPEPPDNHRWGRDGVVCNAQTVYVYEDSGGYSLKALRSALAFNKHAAAAAGTRNLALDAILTASMFGQTRV